MNISTLYSAVRSALLGKRGAAMIEYALLVGLIAVVAIASLNTLSTSISGKFTTVAGQL